MIVSAVALERMRRGCTAFSTGFASLGRCTESTARGTLPKDVSFDGGAYTAGTFVTGQYRFDTWRLTYRYALWQSPKLEAAVGLTGLVRDAPACFA